MTPKDWLCLGKQFDDMAYAYNKYRPDYPIKIINKLLEVTKLNENSKVLEIGAGAGRATKHFVDIAGEIKFLEPGNQMLEIAREKFSRYTNITYLNEKFQDYKIEKEKYDLVIAAETFQWLPKPMAYKKSYKLLKKGGNIALICNKYYDKGRKELIELADIFKQYGILNLQNKSKIQNYILRTVDTIEIYELFKEVEIETCDSSIEYTFDEFMNFLDTCCHYGSLQNVDKEYIVSRLKNLFAKYNNKITIDYKTILCIAKK